MLLKRMFISRRLLQLILLLHLKKGCDIAITFAYKKQGPYVSVASAMTEANLKTLTHLFETNWSFDVIVT